MQDDSTEQNRGRAGLEKYGQGHQIWRPLPEHVEIPQNVPWRKAPTATAPAQGFVVAREKTQQFGFVGAPGWPKPNGDPSDDDIPKPRLIMPPAALADSETGTPRVKSLRSRARGCLTAFLRPYTTLDAHIFLLFTALMCIPILALLSTLLGSSVPDSLRWKKQTAFYNPSDTARENLDAFVTARRDATSTDFVLQHFGLSGRFDLQTVTTTHAGDELALEVVYVARNGDVFEEATLRSIMDFEKTMQLEAGFSSRCLLETRHVGAENSSRSETGCAKPASALRACVPSLCPECLSFQHKVNCRDVRSTPSGLLDCDSADPLGCDPNTVAFDLAFKEYKILEYSTFAFTNSTSWQQEGGQVWTFITSFVDSGFGSGNKFSRALKSKFWFGMPLPGYTSVNDRRTEQEESIQAYMYNTLDPLLTRAKANGESLKFDVHWWGPGMAERNVNEEMAVDFFYLSVVAGLFTLVNAFGLKSWMLAIAGVLHTGQCFIAVVMLASSNIGVSFLGIDSLFLVLAVMNLGCFLNYLWFEIWEQSASVSAERHERLQWAWPRAAKATIVLMLSGSACYGVASESDYPAVRAQCLVAWMHLVLQSLFSLIVCPAMLITFDKHFKRKRFCFGVASNVREYVSDARHATRGVDVDQPLEGRGVMQLMWLPHFFEKKFSHFILENRFVLTFGCLGLGVFFLSQADKLSVRSLGAADCVGRWCYDDFAGLLPSGNNYRDYFGTKGTYFTRGGAASDLKLNVVLGLDADSPVARTAEDKTNSRKLGSPVWKAQNDDPMDLQAAFNCLTKICGSTTINGTGVSGLGAQDSTLRLGGSPLFLPDCWATSFCQHILSSDPWVLDCTNISNARFHSELTSWLNSSTVFSSYSTRFFFEQSSSQPGNGVIKGTYASVRLDANRGMSRETGIELYDSWKGWVASVTSQVKECAPFANQVVVVTDSPGWDSFFLQSSLRRRVVESIVVVVVVSCIVLTIASGNVLVTIWAGVCEGFCVAIILGFVHATGQPLDTSNAIMLLLCAGVAIQSVAAMNEGYVTANTEARADKIKFMLGLAGPATLKTTTAMVVCSSAAWACSLPRYQHQAAMFITTSIISCAMTLFFLPSVLAIVGPNGNWGYVFICFGEHRQLAKAKAKQARERAAKRMSQGTRVGQFVDASKWQSRASESSDSDPETRRTARKQE